ncbi:hypothetical protein K5D68_12845 [Pseudomonas cichorii]|nr:hypothetical protein [Pseudomonas cichorii]MBX8518690.1 hypothetical protein [Pseudomonas cichorii]MBX8550479.1 hypothetical protein [Pseudomonas cichorii]MBX8568780.1 hypothetical protein [Pseudomonas cichorii]MBX8585464.1 hypothetical protein [Pseudomonas cichorii]MBX8603332.1 hypothetical protein [Pseudomonas cichorii]
MSLPPMICSHVSVLRAYLSTVTHNFEAKPNGQLMYSFPDGLILNVYETTGKVVFQGSAPGGDLAKQIAAMINQINTPVLQP